MPNERVVDNPEEDRQAECPCGWVGWLRNTVAGYVSDGHDDVVPADLCPDCGREIV